MGCLRSALLLLVVVMGIGFVATLLRSNQSSTESANSRTVSTAAASAPATTQLSYLDDLKATLADVESANLVENIDTIESIIVRLAVIDAWIRVANRKSSAASSDEERAARTALIKVIRSKQQSAFPALRDAYGPAARKKLWELDGKARTIGKGFRTVEFIAAEFAANRNIKAMQESVHETLLRMRFTRAQYRWFDGASEYQYYDLTPPADGDVGTWMGSSFVKMVE